MSSHQLTILVVRSEVERDIEVRKVEMIPEVREELDFYHWVYIYLKFIKEYGLYNREDQEGVESDPYEEDTKDVVLDDEIEHHWRMVFRGQQWRGGWE